MVLQPRDVEIFEQLLRLRFADSNHLRGLCFSDKHHRTGVQARLRKLCDAGYLGRKMVHAENGHQAGFLYFLQEPAYNHLDADYKRRRLPTEAFLRHTLLVVTIRLRLERLFQDHPSVTYKGFIPEWKTRKLRNGKYVQTIREQITVEGQPRSLLPDGVFVLQHGEARKLFFLEADRGTEYRRKIQKKVRHYGCLLRDGDGLMRKYKVTRSTFGVVLITTKSAKRLRHIQDWNFDRAGFEVFLLTTLQDFEAAPAANAPIWYKGVSKERVPLVKV